MLVAHGANPLGRTISGPHAHGREAGAQPALGAAPPRHNTSSHIRQNGLGGDRGLIRHVTLSRLATSDDGKDHRDIERIDLIAPGDPDGPGQIAFAQRLPERGGAAVGCIAQHAAEARALGTNPVDLREGNLCFGPRVAQVLRHAGVGHPVGITRPDLG